MHMILLQQSCPSVSVSCDAIALNTFSNSLIFGSKLEDNEFSLLVLKPKLALFEFQENFLCFIN